MTGTPRRLAALVALSAVALSTAGCVAMRLIRGEPRAELTTLEPGAPRERVEAQLGQPFRSMTDARGTVHRLYRYDDGFPPRPVEGWALLPLEVALFLLPDVMLLFCSWDQMGLPPVRHWVVVTYDPAGGVIGACGPFDPIPTDGRSPSGAWPGRPLRAER